MEGKNIPPIITLLAAIIACLICIFRGASLFNTLKIVLIVMFLFYIIGRIVQTILVKIDKDAEEAAAERQREEQELAAKELREAELAKQGEDGLEQTETERTELNTEEGVL